MHIFAGRNSAPPPLIKAPLSRAWPLLKMNFGRPDESGAANQMRYSVAYLFRIAVAFLCLLNMDITEARVNNIREL